MSLEIRSNYSGQTAQVALFHDMPRVVEVSFDAQARVAKVVVDGAEVESNRLKTFAKCGDSPHLVLDFGAGEWCVVLEY